MKNNSGISNYHLGVILLYFVFIPPLLFLTPRVMRYHITLTQPVVGTVFAALLGLALYTFYNNRGLKNRRLSLNTSKSIMILGYSAVFAVPEEILFRGVVQTLLFFILGSPFFTVLFSSLVFGLAHIYNGSTGIGPKNWNWKLVFTAFIGGLPLGLLFFLTGSLLWPTVLHVLYLVVFQIYFNDK